MGRWEAKEMEDERRIEGKKREDEKKVDFKFVVKEAWLDCKTAPVRGLEEVFPNHQRHSNWIQV